MPNEKKTDIIVAKMLNSAGIQATPNGSDIIEVAEALKTASKRGTGKKGFPEFVAKVGDFLIVIEDKANFAKQVKYLDEDKKTVLLMDNTSITDYAENGAVHYATHIVNNTSFKKIFAFGCSGTVENRMTIRPIFVSPAGYKLLRQQKDFSNFTADRINEFYTQDVLNQKSQEQIELENILSNAHALHEYLHTYGSLSNLEKPVVVSALLLALQHEDFDTEDLLGIQKEGNEDPALIVTDGEIIINYVKKYMDLVQVEPGQKKSQVLNQFLFIKERPNLSKVVDELGKTPLRFFAEYLYSNVLTAFNYNSAEDVLGRFYGEFMSYSGGDGQSLGIILTPKHITQLMCELVDLQPNDVVFDPTCGTAGFLVAAMPMMLNKARTQQEKEHIKKHQLHGIEQNEGMFSIATTNMILRGDGKSNLICDDFFAHSEEELRQKHFTVGLMNPPYSVATHSELEFMSHLLDSMDDGARCAIIVPQSTMVGNKTKADQVEKNYILQNHTLEGVVTLNLQTFFGVGVNPAIAIFTAHKPHNENYYAKFVNFKDDGYVVVPHVGLIHTPQADVLKKKLLECWHNNRPASSDFMIRNKVAASDEWLHSYFYFNDEIPTDKELEQKIADYISFEFAMQTHGFGYLFDNKSKLAEITGGTPVSVNQKTWQAHRVTDLFTYDKGNQNNMNALTDGTMPLISAKKIDNGWKTFAGKNNKKTFKGHCLTINNDGDGGAGLTYYHPYEMLLDSHVTALYSKKVISKYTYLFMAKCLEKQESLFGHGRSLNKQRLEALSLMLPTTSSGNPDYEYMDLYMRNKEVDIIKKYLSFKELS